MNFSINMIVKAFGKKGLSKIVGGLTNAIEGMSEHDGAEGRKVYIVARRKRLKDNEGNVLKKPDLRFCTKVDGKFKTYRQFDESYLKDAKGTEKVMINQLSPMIMKLIDKFEEENDNKPLIFLIHNEPKVLDNEVFLDEKTTVLEILLDGKTHTKMEFVEILNEL